jgi:hypothetical protein
MKSGILLTAVCLSLISLSSCLKTYNCSCETTTYETYRVIGTKAEKHEFNGSRKYIAVQECAKLRDSSMNDNGTGHIKRCSVDE